MSEHTYVIHPEPQPDPTPPTLIEAGEPVHKDPRQHDRDDHADRQLEPDSSSGAK